MHLLIRVDEQLWQLWLGTQEPTENLQAMVVRDLTAEVVVAANKAINNANNSSRLDKHTLLGVPIKAGNSSRNIKEMLERHSAVSAGNSILCQLTASTASTVSRRDIKCTSVSNSRTKRRKKVTRIAAD